jgi:signal transduction histidine kinase
VTKLRLRLVFGALAITLAIPAALLVQRALESVVAERSARERAVAERVFDEMERALSELLREEEARPASDYDFASPGSGLRARPPGSLALGWFQIEADGSVAAPAWSPRAAALAAEIALDGARLEAASAGSARRRSREGRRPAASPRAPATAPRDAHALAPAADPPPSTPPAASADKGAAPSAQPAPTLRAEADAFAALSKLNTGAKEREERTQRVYVEEQAAQRPAREGGAPYVPADPAVIASSADADVSEARARSEAIVAGALGAELRADAEAPQAPRDAASGGPPAPARSAAAEPVAGAPAEAAKDTARTAPSARDAAPLASPSPALAARPERGPTGSALALAPHEGELVRVVVDPMRGRLARSGELLLVRSAWIGARGVRQGVAFEPSALERLLAATVLAQAELADARLQLAARAALGAAATPAERRSFAHRFGEPFDALGAELSFAPLADDGARSVYWLAALFSVAGAGGLYAAYRTTAVALHFAERRSNFAAAVSHELKTPLTAIRLYAEMLRDGLVSGDEKRREYYGSISAETERLSRLIDNVLEFSRLERGARSLALSVGDPAPVVREAASLLQPHAAAHGLALELSVEEVLPPVRFERDALLQIVFNLVDNAVKYGRGEPARIEVACRRAESGVAIAVRDHGPGVPREELARILEPFYRRGDELTRSAPGAGIGLALVRSLAQQMGAALALSNAEGGGLAVTVTLARGSA